MEKLSKILVFIAGSISVLFGFWHFLFPIIFKWEISYINMPEVLIDTVETTNFAFSVLTIILGIVNAIIVLRYWKNKDLIKIFLIFQSVFILIRFIYGIFRPIRIPIEGIYPLFLILFIAMLLLYIIPLFFIFKNRD